MVLATFIPERTREGLLALVNGLIEAERAAMPGVGFVLGGIVAATVSPRAAYSVAGLGALAVALAAAAALRTRQARAPRPAALGAAA